MPSPNEITVPQLSRLIGPGAKFRTSRLAAPAPDNRFIVMTFSGGGRGSPLPSRGSAIPDD